MRSPCTKLKINRRRLLLGMSALATAASFAQSRGLAESSGPPSLTDPVSHFMFVSRVLVPHELDRSVGHRIHGAFSDVEEDFDNKIKELQDLIIKTSPVDVEHFMPTLTDIKQKNTAMKIISAWYSGVVNGKSKDHTIGFESSLMYKVTNDVMTIPSYAKSAPNGWNSTAVSLLNMPSF
ncbi:sorbitol dehydrogenase family protein [Acetobacter sacchari]|uniref:Sorbitol dehydrogenase family protein n=1 Tax=Acetobacter sacchari TaxID=2661687 RepID=A0ABS3LX38_9PROT|nr:sorbitol dehydrogenase family protein [Acetobacter sacchari]MBO1360421.1 sorbitol dehydrogenase family protein [Acetobacter sacchari]